MERWYFGKLDHLKRADLLLSISESSGSEAREHLNFPAHAVTNISTACGEQFRAIALSEAQQAHLKNAYGISRPFVMNTGGTDQRKNLDGLFRAYASLPAEMRKAHALALVGREVAEQKSHFLDLAKQSGLREDELVFTGYVSDSELNLLYNACTLFVFPSWHEGFGLPVLEAMACGKAVIAANSSSLPEVVGRQDALFAPRDDAAMAAKMAEVLGNAEFREDLERHGLEQAKKFSWTESARRAWVALEKLQAQGASANAATPSHLSRRPKLAFVSPLPPEKTGIADYAAELLPQLARHYDITVIVQQVAVEHAWIQANTPLHDVAWFRQNAHRFDRLLYQMGNSDKHIYMLALMAEMPGMLVLHDFFLSGPLAWCMEEQPEHLRAWTKALYQSHGWKALVDRFKPGNTEQAVFAWPCNLPVLQQALGVIVHSDFSRQLAQRFYDKQAVEDWAVIPLLRQPTPAINRVEARQKLGISSEDFVVCSFGVLGSAKLNQRLLEAWLASPLAESKQCHLVFAGENQGGEYGENLRKTIEQSAAKNRIRITGWVDTENFRTWLAAADMAVQLRAQSRGETSAAVLDCLNYGLPLVVNAHGAMAELPEDALWLLPDAFSNTQLIDALTTLWREPARRAALGARAQQHTHSQHHPRHCADLYAQAIEGVYAREGNGLYGLMQALPQIEPSLPPAEYPSLANALATNFPPQPRRRQLLLDVSELVQRDAQTGIQRVTRALLEQIILNPPAGWAVEAVYATTEQAGYRYARKFLCRFLGMPEDWAEDAPVEVWPGDLFFALDFHPHMIPAQEGILYAWRNRGVRVYFIVYDLLPVLMPEVFPQDSKEGHHLWLQTITRMDGALCISRAVADELHEWLQTFGEKRERPFAVNWFHLGADVDNSNPTRGLPDDASQTLRSLADRPSFLMVGTIEPRKGVLQTLHAFDQLWAQGVDANLVIVGKEGWKPVPDHQRRDIPQTVRALRTHPELGKRLFWLEAISDEYLEQVYATSACLIAASYGEGFGLPLIEGAHHGLPLLVRDIPVFREVSAGHAQFFADARQPEVIAEAVSNWLMLYQNGQHPRSDAMPHITWAESAHNALNIVLGNTPPYRTWLPDGVRRYWGADPRLYTQVGEVRGVSMHTTGKAGYLVYGPYERFEPGRYRIVVQGKTDHCAGRESLDIVCNKGETVLLQPINLANDFLWARQGFEFTLDTKTNDFEIRIWVSEQSKMIVDRIDIWSEAPQPPVTKIGIVLVTYSIVPKLLVNSINSKHSYEWYVFHHGSPELTGNIKSLFSEIESNLYFYNNNRGLAKSWNEGISLAISSGKDIILVINDDVEFIEDGFDLWVDYILENKDSGLVFITGEEPQDDGTTICRSQDFACFAFGKQSIELVGAFDENFTPAYYEDFDYIIRAQLAGIKISVDSRVLCRHRRSSTQKNDSIIREKMPEFFEANRQYFIKKWGDTQPGSGCYSNPFNDKTIDSYIPFKTN